MPFVEVNIKKEIEKMCEESPEFKRAWEHRPAYEAKPAWKHKHAWETDNTEDGDTEIAYDSH